MTATKIYGRLDAYFETGTEGVIWSMRCNYLPGYDGLISIAKNPLTILAYDRTTPLWSGIVDLEYDRRYSSYPSNPQYGQQEIFGYWVHGFERTLSPELWATFFFEKRRAVIEMTMDHPYIGDSNGMKDRLEALSIDKQKELFHNSMYSWFSMFSDGEFNSYAKEWGFSLEETKQLVGGISDSELTAIKTWPKISNDEPVPFSIERFTRLALLYGIYGGLDWASDSTEDKIRMLANPNKEGNIIKDLLLQNDISGIIRVREWLSKINKVE